MVTTVKYWMSYIWRVLTTKIYLTPKPKLISTVKNFEGECWPTWMNTNQVYIRLEGGATGFFKRKIRVYGITFLIGDEFHGMIRDGKVISTEGMTGL